MSPQSEEQKSPHHSPQHHSYPLTPCISPVLQEGHSNTTKRPKKSTTSSVPIKPNRTSNTREAASSKDSSHSDEPADKRVQGGVHHPHNQIPHPQAGPRDEADIDRGTRELEEWMADVTAHPERAIWFRDIDRMLPPTTQLFETLPSDEEGGGGGASNSQPRGSVIQDSTRPMLFCSCCPTDDMVSRMSSGFPF